MNKRTFAVLVFAIAIGGCTLQNDSSNKNISVTPTPALEASVTEKVTMTPTTSPSPTIDETTIIVTDIKKALVTKHGDSANELKITVSKIVGDYASGNASDSGGGGMWFATKANGEWKLVWDGNGIILCSDLTSFPDYPKTLIPECYDQKSEKLIKR